MTHPEACASLDGDRPVDPQPNAAEGLRARGINPWWVIAGAGALIGLTRLVFALLGPSLLVNHTASEPRGIYWLQAHEHQAYARGQLVALSMPVAFRALIASRGWAPEGVPLLKSVEALEGDQVCTDDHEISVNGRRMGPISSVDSQGQALPKIRGCYIVPAGQFLPLSTYIANSFDGRYMGPQPLSLIHGEAHRLWTF